MADKQKDKKQESPEEKPEIVVDDDWKAQAQAEKAKLDEQTQKAGPAAGAEEAPRELPPPTFATLVSSLAAQAMLAMGGLEDPRTKRRVVDLALAKHHIDTLTVLEEKTKGNLTDEEKSLLDQALYQVRIQYVQMAQAGL